MSLSKAHESTLQTAMARFPWLRTGNFAKSVASAVAQTQGCIDEQMFTEDGEPFYRLKWKPDAYCIKSALREVHVLEVVHSHSPLDSSVAETAHFLDCEEWRLRLWVIRTDDPTLTPVEQDVVQILFRWFASGVGHRVDATA